MKNNRTRAIFLSIGVLLVMVVSNGCNRLTYKTIHEAAAKGDLADVKRHLQNGANVNARDINGYTPLLCAADKGQLDVVQYLTDKGADVNAKNKRGKTPLMWAASQGHLDVVKVLVDKDADVNAKDDKGNTPLMWAQKSKAKDKWDVVEFLKQHGAK